MNHPIELPRAVTQPPPWMSQIALRIRRHLAIKLVGVTTFTWLFFIAYFHLLRHPAYTVTLMPQTSVDLWIPFQPQALFAYLSLWFYVGIAPGLQLTLKELIAYGAWIGALCLTGLGLFYLWPTAVPVAAMDVSGFPGFAVLQGVDAAGNACPSMHVAVAIFSAIWVERLLRRADVPRGWRALNILWFAAITYSTLAVKQHVLLDVVAGAALGAGFAWPSLRWHPWASGRPASPAASGAAIIESHRSPSTPESDPARP